MNKYNLQNQLTCCHEKTKESHTRFKTKVILETLQERETIQEIGKKYGIHPNQISNWKAQFISRASENFKKGKSSSDPEKEKSELFK